MSRKLKSQLISLLFYLNRATRVIRWWGRRGGCAIAGERLNRWERKKKKKANGGIKAAGNANGIASIKKYKINIACQLSKQ